MARQIPAFTPELAGDHNVHAYLRDIDFHLQSLMSVHHQDRLYLIWITSSPEVQRFLARQPENIKSNYQQLKQAIIKEFSEFENGLIAALDTKQGRHETPYVYYHRLRRDFGARNESGMEEDTSFKSLFLRNLHPIVSHHLGIMACANTMPIQQLRDLTQKAFNKHKASSKRVCKIPAILNGKIQIPKLAPEGTQHFHNARAFNKKLASRGQNHHHGHRSRLKTNRWEEPWKRTSSPSKHHRTSHSSLQQQHPPPHLSHRCQTEAAQRQLDTPASELQELLALAKELLDQNSPEEYWEERTSDSCPTQLGQA